MRDTDLFDNWTASSLIKQSRHAAGLTQQRLAALANTTQSAIAAYESGSRQPTVPVLSRMLAATGHRLELAAVPEPSLYRLSDVARELAATDPEDNQRRLRLVFEFLRSAQEDGHPLVLLVAATPPPTGDVRFDALLAAIAEDLSVRADEVPPAWVHEPNRILDGAWWVSDLPSARASALVHTPASYRRRGVMIDRHDLVAV